MVSVIIKSSGSKPSINIDFPSKNAGQVTVSDLKKGIHAKFPKLIPVRQKLVIPSSSGNPKDATTLTHDSASLASFGVQESGTTIRCKDLGPQLGWTTVFLAEYAGPIIIHPVMYYLSSTQGWSLSSLLQKSGLSSIKSSLTYDPSALQKTVLALVVLHFVKREYETLYVHKFSHATMPFRNIFKNCGHYWALSGLLIGLSIYSPKYSSSSLSASNSILNNPKWLAGWSAVWLFGEISNYITHLNLRSIRTPPGQPRKFPTGYGFDYITCANYFFESVAWFAILGMTGGDWAVGVFTVIAVLQMAAWADKKHRTYRKEHGKNYPRRARMFPLLY